MAVGPAVTVAQRWETRSFLPVLVDALSGAEADEEVQRLVEAFGGEPASVAEHCLGEPVNRVRKLRFSSGGEIVLYDGAVVGAILHVEPTAGCPGVVDLGQWIAGATNAATLDELKAALELPVRFAGFSSPYVAVGHGYACFRFIRRDGSGGWKEPGNLARIVVTGKAPGLAMLDGDECPTCSDLLVRGERGVDVDATIGQLEAAVSSQAIAEDAHWVTLGDLTAIHASGLVARAESQLRCRTCRRVICLTLYRDGPATFGYHVRDDAMLRPMEPIPPVEQWGSAERIAMAQAAMQYVDHEPGCWFLVRQGDALYFDARYSLGVADDSALIELNGEEREGYRIGGRSYLAELAKRMQRRPAGRRGSPYYSRDLSRRGGEAGRDYRGEFSAAITDDTWQAEQRARRALSATSSSVEPSAADWPTTPD